jgi:hypothetical protein
LHLQLQSNGTRDAIFRWGSFNSTFPFTVFLPFTVSLLLALAFSLSLHSSLPFPGPFVTTLRVIPTLAVVIIIAIATTAPSTTRRSRIHPVVFIIILVDYIIPIQLSNSKQVAWFVLTTAWQLNIYPEIIATIPRETLTGGFNLP